MYSPVSGSTVCSDIFHFRVWARPHSFSKFWGSIHTPRKSTLNVDVLNVAGWPLQAMSISGGRSPRGGGGPAAGPRLSLGSRLRSRSCSRWWRRGVRQAHRPRAAREAGQWAAHLSGLGLALLAALRMLRLRGGGAHGRLLELPVLAFPLLKLVPLVAEPGVLGLELPHPLLQGPVLILQLRRGAHAVVPVRRGRGNRGRLELLGQALEAVELALQLSGE